MGYELHRHLQALLISTAVVIALVMTWYWYFNRPIDVYEIKIVSTTIKTEDKLVVSYRVAKQHECSTATLVAKIDDGVEFVRTHRSSLMESVSTTGDNTVVKEIGLPGFAAPGKAKLILDVEFVCHRLHSWRPLIHHLGTFGFNVVDKSTEERALEKDNQISRLRAEIYGLNIRVLNLTVAMEAMKIDLKKKTTDTNPEPPSAIIKPGEQKLRARMRKAPKFSPVVNLAELERTPAPAPASTPYDPVGDFVKRSIQSFAQ